MNSAPDQWLYVGFYLQPDDDQPLDQNDARLGRLSQILESSGGRVEPCPSGWTLALVVEAGEHVHHLGEAAQAARSQSRLLLDQAKFPPAALVREETQHLASPVTRPPEPDQLLSTAELLARLGISRQRLSQLRQEPWFPSPVKSSARQALWDVRDIEALEARWVRRSGPKPRTQSRTTIRRLM